MLEPLLGMIGTAATVAEGAGATAGVGTMLVPLVGTIGAPREGVMVVLPEGACAPVSVVPPRVGTMLVRLGTIAVPPADEETL